MGLPISFLGIVDFRARGLRVGDSLPFESMLSRCPSSSKAGLLSRLLTMPNLCSSSSIVGLPLETRSSFGVRIIPPGLAEVVSTGRAVRSLGVEGVRFRQLSKQSAQEGRPRRSTRGLSPRFLPHPSQLKHFLCQWRPEA